MKRRCYFCGSTNLVRRIVNEPIFDGDELLGIVKVVAYVCLQCGESYLPHSSMKRAWKERERLKAAKAEMRGRVGEV
ncbi:YgiT-type zinc finger protein [Fervidibacter sacchari]